MDDLIESLTELSLLGRQAINPVKIDPSPLVEEILNTYSDQIKNARSRSISKTFHHAGLMRTC